MNDSSSSGSADGKGKRAGRLGGERRGSRHERHERPECHGRRHDSVRDDAGHGRKNGACAHVCLIERGDR